MAETRILPAVHGFLDARVVAEVGVGEWRRLLAGIGDDGHAADAVAGCVRFVPRVVALSNAKPAQRSAHRPANIVRKGMSAHRPGPARDFDGIVRQKRVVLARDDVLDALVGAEGRVRGPEIVILFGLARWTAN